MKRRITIQLSLMMFLEFFVWGSWFVTMGTYMGRALGSGGGEIGTAYMTQAWGAILAPFIVGLIADRYFQAQKLLGLIHLAGAYLLYRIGVAEDFVAFYPLLLAYMVLYMPTLALANSVAFHQMHDPSAQFARVRVWGTVGWIAAGMLIGYVLQWEGRELLQYTFILGAGSSLVLGLFSFTLPETPPGAKGEKVTLARIVGLDALRLLKARNYLVFLLSSVLICIPLAFYYSFANPFLNEVGMANAAGNMAIGQISEVLFMLLLPVFLNRFGLKWTLIAGMLAWGLRYTLFAMGDAGSGAWMLFGGIILHGICYDFFFVSGQIYTDVKAGEKIRSSAQGLITLATYGVGMLIGYRVSGVIVDHYLEEGGHLWDTIWLYPAGFAYLVLLLFILFFRNEKVNYHP
ncbi:nucleoside permease [Robiginitalea sp. M366]|uniref:nucleoside permease n=1 Tax=Robiginitalea aestuariiviva TaxID=3036903 RepID=UPI00240D5B25|nr:nucleoside permease [Robiginitalea aestuariiviva]MDG1571325.1 nucleoside permease [Robiginitalea aestuariiviva]